MSRNVSELMNRPIIENEVSNISSDMKPNVSNLLRKQSILYADDVPCVSLGISTNNNNTSKIDLSENKDSYKTAVAIKNDIGEHVPTAQLQIMPDQSELSVRVP